MGVEEFEAVDEGSGAVCQRVVGRDLLAGVAEPVNVEDRRQARCVDDLLSILDDQDDVQEVYLNTSL